MSIRDLFKKIGQNFFSVVYYLLFTRREYLVTSKLTDRDYMSMYRLRYKVYCLEKKYLDPNNYSNEQEKDEYDRYSEYIVLKKANEVLGCVRIIPYIEGNPPPFIREYKLFFDPITKYGKNIIEISRFILHKDLRKSMAFIHLLFGIYIYCKNHGIQYVAASIDEKGYRALTKRGLKFTKIGLATSYQGRTFPVISEYKELKKNILINLLTLRLFGGHEKKIY